MKLIIWTLGILAIIAYKEHSLNILVYKEKIMSKSLGEGILATYVIIGLIGVGILLLP